MAVEAIRTSLRPPRFVSEADLERELVIVRDLAAESCAGVFGPSSMMWRIDKEAAIFLGAGRALLLQLAHPWIAAAIAQHSPVLTDPIGRFHRTFKVMFTIVFGTTEQGLAAARRLHRRHARISGTLVKSAGPFPAGSRYEANEVAALRWVHATLIDTALVAHDLVRSPPSTADRERYWTEARLFAAFFGIPQDALPQSWADFAANNEAMWRSDVLTVCDEARSIARAVLRGAGSWLPIPSWYRALTARLLPARLREDFGLPYGASERRKAERALAVLRRLYRWVPGRLRHVGPYQEAHARLAGRQRPGPTTQLLNRFWIGQKSMTE
ncbi:MAG TPA: oxygenase MpaB family protein [Stellaceae bacterium]|nr:oxygenase MpaB family protein [Stellaceae bacterium]